MGVTGVLLTMPMFQFNDTLKKIPNGQKVILCQGQTLKLIIAIRTFRRKLSTVNAAPDSPI
jgi:hypothetical protein